MGRRGKEYGKGRELEEEGRWEGEGFRGEGKMGREEKRKQIKKFL